MTYEDEIEKYEMRKYERKSGVTWWKHVLENKRRPL